MSAGVLKALAFRVEPSRGPGSSGEAYKSVPKAWRDLCRVADGIGRVRDEDEGLVGVVFFGVFVDAVPERRGETAELPVFGLEVVGNPVELLLDVSDHVAVGDDRHDNGGENGETACCEEGREDHASTQGQSRGFSVLPGHSRIPVGCG